MTDLDSQIRFAEQFDRLWRGDHPHIVTTMGTSLTIDQVHREFRFHGLTRLPIPAAGFTLWGFATAADANAFLHGAPLLCR